MSTRPARTPTPLGKIVTTLTVTNHSDQIAVERSALAPEGVRSVTLDNVLVDSGATTLCLPADVIAQLGLTVRREVPIATATGPGTARLFQDAAITLLGREGTFDCLELPAGATPPPGGGPPGALGVEGRLPKGRPRPLPHEPGNTPFSL